MHAVLWDEAVMAPLPRQRVNAMDRRAFAMFNASPHCIWEPMKRLGAAGEWCACNSLARAASGCLWHAGVAVRY